jgi:adenylate cyclase
MDDAQFAAIAEWLSLAGLAGQDEAAMVTGFCERLVALGLPLARGRVFISTLHPVYAGRGYFWTVTKGETVSEYGPAIAGEALERWQRSPFYQLEETGAATLRRRVTSESGTEFPYLGDLHAAGLTEYFAVIDRFGADAIMGEMDCVYSSWITDAPQGFTEDDIAALRRLTPSLALAVKSATLRRIAKTVVETYLGRDPGRRVLEGSITRGTSTSIEAVLWFSDLRGYTSISDRTPPSEIIPFLNDYAETVISAIHSEGGDVLKLMGDGTLAMFASADRTAACRAALAAASTAFAHLAALKERRIAAGLPATDLYLGLHLGEVVGPAVNEVSRIAGMCRLVEQAILVSSAFFAALGAEQDRLVSVGRYALRGVGQPQELYTLDRAQ